MNTKNKLRHSYEFTDQTLKGQQNKLKMVPYSKAYHIIVPDFFSLKKKIILYNKRLIGKLAKWL